MWRFYYRNDRLKTTGNLAAGQLDGYWEWWGENGQPLPAGAFADGVPIGPLAALRQ